MNNIHIHLHLPDAESTEKVVPLLDSFLKEAGNVTEESINAALQKNAGPFSDPQTTEIEKKLDAMDYQEEPATKKKKAAKKTKKEKKAEPEPEATPVEETPAEDLPSREDVFAVMTKIIQAKSENRKKVHDIIIDLDAKSFREIPDEKLGIFQQRLEQLEA